MNLKAQLNRGLIALGLCAVLGAWAWAHPADANIDNSMQARKHAADETRVTISFEASRRLSKPARNVLATLRSAQ